MNLDGTMLKIPAEILENVAFATNTSMISPSLASHASVKDTLSDAAVHRALLQADVKTSDSVKSTVGSLDVKTNTGTEAVIAASRFSGTAPLAEMTSVGSNKSISV